MRFVFLLLFLTLTGLLCAQTRVIDSLEQKLDSFPYINQPYSDLLNTLSFEYLKTDPVRGAQHVNHALRVADSLNYMDGLFRAMINKGSAFWLTGLHDMALSYYFEAMEFEVDNPVGFASLNNNIGEVFKKQKQYDSALHYYRRAQQIVENELPGRYPSIITANMAELYLFMGRLDSAEFYYTKSFDYAIIEENKRGLAYALYGLAEIEFHNGNITRAIEIHRNSLMVREKIDDQRGIIQSLLRIGAYLRMSQSGDDPLKPLQRAKRLAIQHKAHDLLSEAYVILANYHEEKLAFQSANEYLYKLQSLKDSLQNEAFVQSIGNIKAALQSELAISENELLREQFVFRNAQFGLAISENELLREQQQAQTVESQIKTGVIVTITVFILVMAAFLYQYYRLHHVSRNHNVKLSNLNNIIQRKNEEIEEINQGLDQELLKTNKMLEESQEITKLGSWEYDYKQHTLRWTKETFRQFGLEPASVDPSNELIKRFTQAPEFRKIREAIEECKEAKTTISREILFEDASGTAKHMLVRFVPEFEKDELVRMFGSSLDITEKVLMDEKERRIIQSLLQQSKYANLKVSGFNEFIEGLLEESVNILSVDLATFWLFSKEQGALNRMKSFALRDAAFESGGTLIASDFPAYFDALFSDRTLAIHNVQTDSRTVEFDRTYFEDYAICSRLDAPVHLEGEFLGILSLEKAHRPVTWSYSDQRYAGSLSDIIANAVATNQNQKLVNEKSGLIEKLIKKNQNLREFAYVISHNLRGPVTQIMGWSDIYHHKDSEDLRPQMIGHIKDAAHNLDRVIKDLSIVLRNQEDDHEQTSEIHLAEMVESVLQSLAAEVAEAQPSINYDYPDGLILKTNRAFLYNILYNLLSNALKYRSDHQRCEVTISVDAKSPGMTQLVVKDNGLGMDMDLIGNKIFKMYQRFHPEVKGRGIGLYIVRNQIEVLGGQIEVMSEPGGGTTFNISLPMATHEQVLVG